MARHLPVMSHASADAIQAGINLGLGQWGTTRIAIRALTFRHNI
jgi:hypothetical protein